MHSTKALLARNKLPHQEDKNRSILPNHRIVYPRPYQLPDSNTGIEAYTLNRLRQPKAIECRARAFSRLLVAFLIHFNWPRLKFIESLERRYSLCQDRNNNPSFEADKIGENLITKTQRLPSYPEYWLLHSHMRSSLSCYDASGLTRQLQRALQIQPTM